MREDQQRRRRHQRDRREILERVERLLGVEMAIGDMAGHHHHQRLSVGRKLRKLAGRYGAVGAGPVLDDHRMAPHLLQFRADVARDDVGRAAGAEAYENLDRPGGPVLRRRRRHATVQQHQPRNQHPCPPRHRHRPFVVRKRGPMV
jgi:hypothetical protein